MDDNRVFVTYMYPIQFIVHENEKVDFSLEEINNLSYDHSLLHRIIGTITNTYENKRIEYLICGDGALGVEVNGNITKDDLVFHYNDLLCKMFLGGINVEAITNEDIVSGDIYKSKSIWPVDFGHSWNSHIHGELRMKTVGVTDAIFLFNAEDRNISLKKVKEAIEKGKKIVKGVPNLSTYHLLKGITEYKYRNWTSALTLLWIVVEELTDFLWKTHIVDRVSGKKRKETLVDSRTYTMAVKQEVLFQKGLLRENLYNDVFYARQARNKLIHEGKRISENNASKVYDFVKELLEDI